MDAGKSQAFKQAVQESGWITSPIDIPKMGGYGALGHGLVMNVAVVA